MYWRDEGGGLIQGRKRGGGSQAKRRGEAARLISRLVPKQPNPNPKNVHLQTPDFGY